MATPRPGPFSKAHVFAFVQAFDEPGVACRETPASQSGVRHEQTVERILGPPEVERGLKPRPGRRVVVPMMPVKRVVSLNRSGANDCTDLPPAPDGVPGLREYARLAIHHDGELLVTAARLPFFSKRATSTGRPQTKIFAGRDRVASRTSCGRRRVAHMDWPHRILHGSRDANTDRRTGRDARS